MPDYELTAVTTAGELIQAKVSAVDGKEVIEQTRSRGLFVTDMHESGDGRAIPPRSIARSSWARLSFSFAAIGLLVIAVFFAGCVLTVAITGWPVWTGPIGGGALVCGATWALARLSNWRLRRLSDRFRSQCGRPRG